MKKSVLASMVTCVFLCGFCVPGAFGQAVFGSILGTVTDPSGAAVANAKVTVIDQGKGTTDQTTTNESGNYTVTHLIPDAYTVQVEAAGFKKLEFRDIQVSADTGARVDGQFVVAAVEDRPRRRGRRVQPKGGRGSSSLEPQFHFF